MDNATSVITISGMQKPSNYDEVSMQQRLQFSESLKDLKNLREQLYSAAEYFETSYSKHDQKQIVVRTLKEYAAEAFTNTVDHVGFITDKIACLLNEKMDDDSTVELRLSCIERRVQTCNEFINYRGLSQQSLAIKTPKHHMQYILPDAKDISGGIKSMDSSTSNDNLESDIHDSGFYIRGDSPTPLAKKGHFVSHFPRFGSMEAFPFIKTSPNRIQEKQSGSPLHFRFMRSGSLVNRSTTLRSHTSRSTSPNPFTTYKRFPSEPRRSASMANHTEKDQRNDTDSYTSKNKRLFKALLSMRKPQKESKLYKFLDEN